MAKKTFCDGCGEQLLYTEKSCFRIFLMEDDWNIDKSGETYDLCYGCVDGLLKKDDE